MALSLAFTTMAPARETPEAEHHFEAQHSMGTPALLDATTRTIDVSMFETEDRRMVLEPRLIEMQRGENGEHA
jgi:hypothetical protein